MPSDAPPIARLTPVPVVGPTNLRSLSSGLRHTVARRIDGTAALLDAYAVYDQRQAEYASMI